MKIGPQVLPLMEGFHSNLKHQNTRKMTKHGNMFTKIFKKNAFTLKLTVFFNAILTFSVQSRLIQQRNVRSSRPYESTERKCIC